MSIVRLSEGKDRSIESRTEGQADGSRNTLNSRRDTGIHCKMLSAVLFDSLYFPSHLSSGYDSAVDPSGLLQQQGLCVRPPSAQPRLS